MGKRLNPRYSNVAVIFAILFVAIGLKAIFLAIGAFPFNGDEAIVGLMASHILDGEWPVFFYGQAYMGSLDAVLVALGMAVFGKEVFVIRIVQVLLYAGTIITTIHIGQRIFQSRWTGWVAGLLMAIPPVNVTLYTTISLGGYGEAILIGNLLLILALMTVERPDSFGLYVLWGVLAGLGFWTFGLTLIYSLPSAIYILIRISKQLQKKEIVVRVVLSLIAASVGALPWIAWAVSHGPGQLFQEMMGSAIAGTSMGGAMVTILKSIRNLILFGTSVIFGLRPPWEIRWLAIPLLPYALAFWMVVVVDSIRHTKQRGLSQDMRMLLFCICGFLIVGYILTPFGTDPSGRYFVPLAVPMSLFAAEFLVSGRRISGKKWALILIIGILAFNLWGNLQSAFRNPPGITTQFDAITWIDHRYDEALIQFLVEQGELRGYTTYWVAYPLAFLSEERLIYIPMLPYHQDFRHTTRDNRYAEYTPLVTDADRVAYITTNHSSLDEFLRNRFQVNKIRWREIQIGDYQVFFDLEPSIHLRNLDPEWLLE